MSNKFLGFLSPNSTPVPDELFDELMSTLSGAELKVLLYIIRRTFGFKKHADNISLHQICSGITTREGEILDRGTGLSLSSVQLALKGLIEKMCVITVRNKSKEKGDLPTTYSLKIRPLTENQQGGLPNIGNGGYRKSVPQQTVKQQTGLQLRNSKANSQDKNEHLTSKAQESAIGEGDHSSSPNPQNPGAGETRTPRTGSLRTLGEILAMHQPPTGHQSPVAPERKLTPTPQLIVAVTEISKEFGDIAHLRSNTSQAVNIWQASGRSEAALISSLYEARSITRQQRDVRRPMPYFWSTVRDLMGVQKSQEQDSVISHAPAATHTVHNRLQQESQERTAG